MVELPFILVLFEVTHVAGSLVAPAVTRKNGRKEGRKEGVLAWEGVVALRLKRTG